ncbi:STAS domain-containing protein [Pseudonocardia sp. ICBG1034]|uniref:STAS domain-containing protein n=1 Tax=Pseudonocardia sp. ICBG1034 TaxID=2844381 RepID=UPI001CCE5E01|nr:STAS domain-containing protein [Pseudonocardia sp. ICBG1034]
MTMTHTPAAAPPEVPGITIDVRAVEAAHGVTVTVTGAVRYRDAALLSRHLHTALDAEPTVVVVNLSRVPTCHLAGVEALAAARDRALATGTGLHLMHLGAPETRDWLTAAGLD